MSVPELVTPSALTRLWDHLKKGQKQRLYVRHSQMHGHVDDSGQALAEISGDPVLSSADVSPG
jgi:hypothetical protein